MSFLFAGSREHAMRRVFHPSAPLGGLDIGVVEQVRQRVWRVPDPLLRAHLLEG